MTCRIEKPILKPLRGRLGLLGWFGSSVKGCQLSVYVTADGVHINSIRVDLAMRGTGIGTTVLISILAFAQRKQLPVTLIPTADHARDQRRLVAWYKRFGFVTDIDDSSMRWTPIKRNQNEIRPDTANTTAPSTAP